MEASNQSNYYTNIRVQLLIPLSNKSKVIREWFIVHHVIEYF